MRVTQLEPILRHRALFGGAWVNWLSIIGEPGRQEGPCSVPGPFGCPHAAFPEHTPNSRRLDYGTKGLNYMLLTPARAGVHSDRLLGSFLHRIASSGAQWRFLSAHARVGFTAPFFHARVEMLATANT